MFREQLQKLHKWLMIRSETYTKWVKDLAAARDARAERREIDRIAATCDELEPTPAGCQSIYITDARITDLLNHMGAERADQVIAAGRNPGDIRVAGRGKLRRRGIAL